MNTDLFPVGCFIDTKLVCEWKELPENLERMAPITRSELE